MRWTRRAAACAALLGCVTLLAAGCGRGGAQPAPAATAPGPPAPLRTLYVQAPLTGPAADEGRAMVDAVRLVVGQANGLAGKVRVIVRPLDDGGVATATDPKRCAANAERAVADPGALAVIGTYELACSEQALEVLRPAGLLLVSPLNAADNLPGALRLAPTAGDQGTAAAQLANALGATRVAIVSRRTGAAVEFATALSSTAPTLGIDPIVDLDASATPIPVLVDEIRAGQVQVVALAGSPGRWADELLRALATLPKAVRPAVVAPQAFDTLAFLDGAGVAAEGVHVLSRLVPAEQLGGDARTFAGAYADLHGQPPPVAIYAADAARAVLEAVAGTTPSRAAVAKALLALPAHDGLLGRWAATATGGITPRRMAVLVVAGGTFRAERVISVAEPLPSSGEVK